MSANTNSKFICKDITKHPEYQKVLAVKDKKIQERMINCLKTKFKNGFDLRQFTQKFDQPNKTYVITKYTTHTKKDSTETFHILYDEDGFMEEVENQIVIEKKGKLIDINQSKEFIDLFEERGDKNLKSYDD